MKNFKINGNFNSLKSNLNKILYKKFSAENINKNSEHVIQVSKELSTAEYEKQWTMAYLSKKNKDILYLEKEMNEFEKNEVFTLFKKTIKLNDDEIKYFMALIHDSHIKDSGIDLFESTTFLPESFSKNENSWPYDKQNWMNTPSLNSTLASFSGSQSAQSNFFK